MGFYRIAEEIVIIHIVDLEARVLHVLIHCRSIHTLGFGKVNDLVTIFSIHLVVDSCVCSGMIGSGGFCNHWQLRLWNLISHRFMYGLQFFGNRKQPLCCSLNCTEIDICANESSAEFHCYCLCCAAAHKAVKDKVARIRGWFDNILNQPLWFLCWIVQTFLCEWVDDGNGPYIFRKFTFFIWLIVKNTFATSIVFVAVSRQSGSSIFLTHSVIIKGLIAIFFSIPVNVIMLTTEKVVSNAPAWIIPDDFV